MADEKILDTENVSNFIHDIIDSDLNIRIQSVKRANSPKIRLEIIVGEFTYLHIHSGQVHDLFHLFADFARARFHPRQKHKQTTV